jgi:2-polyprenyl-6-methoxyphenol hydroxylase-like FAD-dependent oxidoreductase
MQDVTIVGAGPTGLALGIELVKRGVAVRIVSDRDGPSTLSKAYGIHPRTLEILDAMGILEAALAEGSKTVGANLHVDGRHCLRVPLTPDGTAFPFLLALPQSRTERLLLARLRAHGGRVEWGTRLAPADLRALKGWVVGCDGAHSTVRETAGIPFVGRSYTADWLLADVQLETPLVADETHGHVGPRGYLALNPRKGPGPGCFRLIADVSGTDLAGRRDLGRRALDRLLEQRGVAARLVAEPEATAPFRTACRRAEVFRRGDVLLAGDAAHVHSPIGGQGLNAGIQDAFNLGWKLAGVVHGTLEATALDTYGAERLPVVTSILRGTHWTRRLLVGRSRVARRGLRSFSLGVRAIPGGLRWFGARTNGLGTCYATNPLVQGSRRVRTFAAGTFAGPLINPRWDAVRAGEWATVPLEDGVARIRPDGIVGERR